jgi:Tfp pilus assembly protein PilO
MKLKQLRWLLLILAVVVIGAIWIGLVLTQQAGQQQELKRNILLVQQRISQIKIDELTSKQTQLTQDKGQYTTQVVDAKARLSTSLDDISATDTILKSAHAYNLTIFQLASSGETNGSMAGNQFVTLPLNYRVSGSLTNLADFVSNIKTLFPTSVVQQYDFITGNSNSSNTSDNTTSPVPTPSGQLYNDYTEATVNIIIYDYKG